MYIAETSNGVLFRILSTEVLLSPKPILSNSEAIRGAQLSSPALTDTYSLERRVMESLKHVYITDK